ncbi:MAG: hypothetical protein L0387_09140 [Acidobacteria bacterium]|nr:hypothetical protein [Acidobacteriota bacterium]
MKRRLCLLLWLALPEISLATEAPTFSKDIFPILQEKCVECHRPGEMAPMSLITYKEVRPWAVAMREAVLTRRMPPWYAEGPLGHFANDLRLTADEIRMIKEWVEAKAPEGNPADLPPARAFAEGWVRGTPNLILAIPAEVQVPATGNDLYPSIILEHTFERDTWVSRFEIRPENRQVVHHANLHMIVPDPGVQVEWSRLVKNGEGKNDKGYAVKGVHVGVPGRFAFDTSKETAVLLPKGSRLRIDLHYVATGKPETDRTRVGIYFAEGRVDKERRNLNFQTKEIRILPNVSDHVVRGVKEVTEPITVTQVACHMHLRGKSYRIVAELPDGKEVLLMNVPQYSFSWQQLYELAQPVKLPGGTRLHYIATYDNSRRNTALEGYDTPDREVTWGQRTIDEMMGGHVLHTSDGEHLGLTIDSRTGQAVGP